MTADPSDSTPADSITSINVALVDPADAAAFSRDVSERLPTIAARPTNTPDDRTTTFVVVERFHLAIAIVTIVGSAVFLLALMAMTVEERRGTVGILRLLGFTRQRILIQVVAEGAVSGFASRIPTGGPLEGPEIPGYARAGPSEPVKVEDSVLAGFGWQREDMKLVQQMASNGAEPIGSLGYDGPLAALSPRAPEPRRLLQGDGRRRHQPGDRPRARDRALLLPRRVRRAAARSTSPDAEPRTIETAFPIILGGHHEHGAALGRGLPAGRARSTRPTCSRTSGRRSAAARAVLDISCLESETTAGRARAPASTRPPRRCSTAPSCSCSPTAPPTRASGRASTRTSRCRRSTARCASTASSRTRRTCAGARRSCCARARSATCTTSAWRSASGADGVCPYVMIEVICVDDYEERHLEHLLGAAQGHREGDLDARHPRGARLRAAVLGDRAEAGAGRDLRARPATTAPSKAGTGFAELDAEAAERQRILAGAGGRQAGQDVPLLPEGLQGRDRRRERHARRFEEYSAKVRELEHEQPISMRHILDLKSDREPIDPSQVDPGVGHHSYPIVISSMSFGSQGETAFRAYPEAAKRINIICVNGEGGEIRDMYGKYPMWRGQQVASGRFGVTSEMLNSSYLVEIKIGQGAKPGEGGHLPAKKVSEKVAAARNASPGTDLISPSNNHDLYSIEDLAELIDELKTANPDVRVSVKVPVVPEHRHDRRRHRQGGRRHHHAVGLRGRHRRRAPARAAPRRPAVGHRHARRAPGAARGGHPQPRRDLGRRRLPPRLGHREAALPGREPRRVRHAGDGLARLHDLPRLPARHLPRRHRDADRVDGGGRGEGPQEVHAAGVRARRRELRALLRAGWARRCAQVVAELGYERAQDLVGRSDLLVQARAKDAIDLTEMIRPLEEMLDLEPIDMPVSAEEEREEAGLIVARPIRMEAKEASHELAALATEVCGGPVSISIGGGARRRRRRRATARRRGRHGRARVPARRSTPTTACSAPSSPAQLSRARIFRPDDRAARRRWSRSPTCTSTAARSAARASARSTSGASTSASRAARRTASARRCSAARSRS